MESHPFRLIRNLGRTREIVTVLLNHGFGDIVDRIGLRDVWQRWQRIVRRQPAAPIHHLTTVERIRLSLEKLGPTFIKFGQVMSTRPDLVPPEMLKELCKLQETVPVFPAEAAIAVAMESLGGTVEDLFASFDRVPIAAGSLAQVHRAMHKDGTELAVKIRRPTAVRDVERDLMLLKELAALIQHHVPESRVFDPIGLVNHFSRSIRRELNFAREGRTMIEFRRWFKDDHRLYVGRVYPKLTTDSVLTMEFIRGERIDQPEILRAKGIDPKHLACRGASIVMRQVFEIGTFHGDPHPGNIRVLPDGSLCLLDWGLVGQLDLELRERLVDLLLAVSKQNVDTAVDLVQRIAEVPPQVDRALLTIDMRDFIANYYGVELEQLQIGNLLADFVTLLANHQIRCPGGLMLLIRALVTLDGVGRGLDPAFNLAAELQPFIQQSVLRRLDPRRVFQRFKKDSYQFLDLARSLPLQLGQVAEKLSRDDLKIQLEHRHLEHLTHQVEKSSNRLAVGMVVSALIVASALMARSGNSVWWVTTPIYALSSVLALWLIYGIFRSGRL